MTNSTIFNDHWVVVCEPTDPKWRQARLNIRLPGSNLLPSESLCKIQEREAREGFVIIEPVRKINNTWYLRNVSNLGPSHPVGHTYYPTMEAALEAAKVWHSNRPTHREVAYRKFYVNG